ncbi:MAG: hypothetical protein IT363_01750 [Methanoregulaceae archaeon]|jgi:hypothetical protein|nr:hypothetical protein [Methanoregulaceae archaeon]
MQKISLLAGLVALGVAVPFVQTPSELDHEGLKKMITGLGYEVKEEKLEDGGATFEFVEKPEDFTIPILAEISASKRYIWLTVFLGDPPKDVAKHTNLLKHNAETQPAFFFITKSNKLKFGLAIDNRGLTSEHLKRVIGLVVEGVTSTGADWGSSTSPLRNR